MASVRVHLDLHLDVNATEDGTLPIAGPFPRNGEDLRGQWLAMTLGLSNQTTHDVRVTRIGEGRGHMGSAYRIAFSCSHDDHPIESVVVKLPAVNPAARATAERGGLYSREYRFFADVAPEGTIRAPRCFAAGYDPDAGFALVLEDLCEAHDVDQLSGLGAEHAMLLLGQLARFHAAWWRAPVLNSMTWATRHTDAHRVDNLVALLRVGWPRLCAEFADQLPSSAMHIGSAMTEQLATAFTALDAEPQTLLHGDLRLDNLLFEHADGPSEAVVLDWQSISRGAAALDVSYFLAQNLPTHVIASHGDALLEHYCSELAHLDVSYSLPALRRAVALASPLTFAVAASLFVITEEDQRTRELARVMATRAIAFAETFRDWELPSERDHYSAKGASS